MEYADLNYTVKMQKKNENENVFFSNLIFLDLRISGPNFYRKKDHFIQLFIQKVTFYSIKNCTKSTKSITVKNYINTSLLHGPIKFRKSLASKKMRET